MITLSGLRTIANALEDASKLITCNCPGDKCEGTCTHALCVASLMTVLEEIAAMNCHGSPEPNMDPCDDPFIDWQPVQIEYDSVGTANVWQVGTRLISGQKVTLRYEAQAPLVAH